jgi:hypothetical protein
VKCCGNGVRYVEIDDPTLALHDEISELKRQLETAKDTLQEIKFEALQGDETSSEITCYNLASDCLFKLESAGE